MVDESATGALLLATDTVPLPAMGAHRENV
jgi:hypothetical protein